jgi:GntR family transcriptional regulator of vanillate catabolism
MSVSLDSDEAGLSLTAKAQLHLRELILSGELKPGQRIAELALVERIGVSRISIRTALARLQEEGLLDALPGGGYVVKDFSEDDVHDAIELRGTLEGLAARLAAERGVSPVLMAEARECIERIDELLAQPEISALAFGDYVKQNNRLHALLAEMPGSELVRRHIERAKTLPFASPNAFVFVSGTGPRSRDALLVAQAQHRAFLDAIEAGEGARAEALMREHARIAHENLSTALLCNQTVNNIPGARLIRRPPSR